VQDLAIIAAVKPLMKEFGLRVFTVFFASGLGIFWTCLSDREVVILEDPVNVNQL
jgi:hypothetical protein